MTTTITSSSSRIQLVAMFAGISLLGACALEGEALPEDESEAEAEVTTGNVVTSWAAIAADAIVRPDEATTTLRSPGPSAMLMAQVQLAVYDAMAAIYKEHYAFSYRTYASDFASKEAAAATAAYRILRTRVPGRAAFLDAQYATTMNAIVAGTSKTSGTNLGEAAAAHYLSLRASDNIDASYTWVQPAPGPGVFEPVAAAAPVDYKMVFVPPFTFGIGQTSAFFPPAPPALGSTQYAAAYDETRSLGGANSPNRTEAQKQLALWTGENAFRWTSRNLNELAVAKGLTRMDAARFFALAYTSVADSFQTGMSAKYQYNRWRPFHAIPRAETDGNGATTADAAWTPLLNVNHPEYPAGHGFIGAGSMVEAVRAFFRTDAVSWTVSTVGVTGLTETSRSYTSLTALANDVKQGRILAGLHFRYSVDAGQQQGRAVVTHINNNFFRRRF